MKTILEAINIKEITREIKKAFDMSYTDKERKTKAYFYLTVIVKILKGLKTPGSSVRRELCERIDSVLWEICEDFWYSNFKYALDNSTICGVSKLTDFHGNEYGYGKTYDIHIEINEKEVARHLLKQQEFVNLLKERNITVNKETEKCLLKHLEDLMEFDIFPSLWGTNEVSLTSFIEGSMIEGIIEIIRTSVFDDGSPLLDDKEHLYWFYDWEFGIGLDIDEIDISVEQIKKFDEQVLENVILLKYDINNPEDVKEFTNSLIDYLLSRFTPYYTFHDETDNHRYMEIMGELTDFFIHRIIPQMSHEDIAETFSNVTFTRKTRKKFERIDKIVNDFIEWFDNNPENIAEEIIRWSSVAEKLVDELEEKIKEEKEKKNDYNAICAQV